MAGRVKISVLIAVILMLFPLAGWGAGTCDPQGGVTTIGLEYIADGCPPSNWSDNTNYRYIINAINCMGGKVNLYAPYGDFIGTPSFLTFYGKYSNYKVFRNTKGNHIVFVHRYYTGLLDGIDAGNYSAGQAYYDLIDTVFFPPAAVSDNDGDGFTKCDECNDNDPLIYPGAEEICDGKDNNCNGEVDENLSFDSDGDGHFTPDSCKSPKDDCNDGDASIFPGAAEICDNKDNNCNGITDEGCCEDADGDGHNKFDAVTCPTGDDCNDEDASIFPGAEEICDNKDNNCNGEVDEGCCHIQVTKNTGNSTINPHAGGSVRLSASVTDPSGKPISWKITLPNGHVVTGTGSSPSATWDGKDADGRYPNLQPNDSTVRQATVSAWHTDDPSCSDQAVWDITITMDDNCMLHITVGSSANTASGNLSHNQELFSKKGAGLAAGMTLYYNSLDPYSGPLGVGWTHNYNIAIGESSDGYVVMTDGTGGRSIYTKSGSGYISQPGDYSVLTKDSNGAFVLTHKDGTKYNFNAEGRIASIADRNGNAITFGYTDGNLTTITDPADRVTTINYDASSHISTITGPDGSAYSFTVIGNALTSVTYPNGGQWYYTYDDKTFMLTKTDPNGNTTAYTYDARHRIVSSTDPEGKIKSIVYPDPDDINLSKTTVVTETDGGVWQYAYDTQAGTLTSKTDPQGWVTSYTYDDDRNMLSKTDPDGSITTYTYDASGNMTSTSDAQGQTTSYMYNAYGQVTSITDPLGGITTNMYDARGNLISTTDPAGATTSYQYDSRGNVTRVTNADGRTTTYIYDQHNNLISITDPAGATTTFTYDINGNITSQTDPNGNTTTFVYDSRNNLIKVTNPLGNDIAYTYDNNGNKTSMADANGNTTYYEYNYRGQITQVKDSLGGITSYAYGGTGCPSCGGGGDKLTLVMDANGNTTRYEYDTLGRLIKEIDPLGNVTSYTYDAKGNLMTKTDANGATITYSYDGLGRLLKKSYPDNTTQTFTYDAKGNILTAANQNISYILSYDANGRVTSMMDSNGRTVSYHYDILGNKTKLTYPDGSTINYVFDTANRLSGISANSEYGTLNWSYAYDSLGRRTKLIYPNGESANYAYDVAGRLTRLYHLTSKGSVVDSFNYTLDKVGNRLTKTEPDTTHTYSYDALYRLTEALSSAPGYSGNTTGRGKGISNATQEQKEFYTYDLVGNRLTSDNSTYTYNRVNQLLTNSGAYAYDKNGNLISKFDGTITFNYSYDYENRLTKVVKTEGSAIVITRYKYDPFGRRIEKEVSESRDATIARYVYDNENVILEYNGNGNIGNFIHGPGIDDPLAIINHKDTYYYHVDGLGSIVALTDSSGKTVQTYEYDSFGNLKDQKNRVKQPYTFTAREWDKEAGLYYYRARYYDATEGRFISKDPIGFSGGISLNGYMRSIVKPHTETNLYVYTNSNPLNGVDPFGLYTLQGFPPELQGQVVNAINEVFSKLSEEPCCAGGKDKAQRYADLLSRATIVYKPDLPYCGYTPFLSLLFFNEIQIGSQAFNYSACCYLSSTILHEVSHLNLRSEGTARTLEANCFGCR